MSWGIAEMMTTCLRRNRGQFQGMLESPWMACWMGLCVARAKTLSGNDKIVPIRALPDTFRWHICHSSHQKIISSLETLHQFFLHKTIFFSLLIIYSDFIFSHSRTRQFYHLTQRRETRKLLNNLFHQSCVACNKLGENFLFVGLFIGVYWAKKESAGGDFC